MTAQRGEFVSHQDALAVYNDPSLAPQALRPLTGFAHPSELVSLLRSGSLCSVQNGSVNRLTYILIDPTFLTGLIAEHYATERDAIHTALNALFFSADLGAMDDEAREDFAMFSVGEHAVKALNMTNGDQPTAFIQKHSRTLFTAHHRAPTADTEYALVQFALLHRIYADLGRSFFPQCMRSQPKRQHDFTAFLLTQQQARQQRKAHEYSVDNSYDEETQQRYQWT